MESSYKTLKVYTAAQQLWALFCNDSLFRNSVYLMLSTGVMSAFGFVFWVITTHFYSSEQIGLATALISVTVLISNLSMFGFNVSLIRYLSQAEKPNHLINTSLVSVALVTVIISVIYLLGIDYFAPSFQVLGHNTLYSVLFILFMIAVSLNTLTDSVFVAYRSSKYNLIVYTFFGLTKIVLPFFLLGLGTYGIFFSYTGAVLISITLSIYFMIKKFNYKPDIIIDREIARRMINFSLSNYAVAFIAGFPSLAAPVLIVDEFGAQDSAYFYMASTIAALLYIIPQAIAQSLFAEGAYKEEEFISFTKSAVKLTVSLLVPAILITFLLGKYILLIFGREYSVHSYYLLQIMALSSIFLSINSIGSIAMRIKHQMKMLLQINFLALFVTAILAYYLLRYGTAGIAWAILGGQAFLSVCFFAVFSKKIHKILR